MAHMQNEAMTERDESTRCYCGSANTYLSGEGYERELVCRECLCVESHPELTKPKQ
jgi:hypothetical protein